MNCKHITKNINIQCFSKKTSNYVNKNFFKSNYQDNQSEICVKSSENILKTESEFII